MKSSVGLVLALVLIAALTGCSKRTYTVTVTEPAATRIAPAGRAEPLDRLRASGERLRDSAARAASRDKGAAASIGSDVRQPTAMGTSGTSREAAGSPPAVNGQDAGIGPGSGRPVEPGGVPPTTAATPVSSRELPLDAIVLVVLLAGAAIAAAALLLRRRRSA